MEYCNLRSNLSVHEITQDKFNTMLIRLPNIKYSHVWNRMKVYSSLYSKDWTPNRLYFFTTQERANTKLSKFIELNPANETTFGSLYLQYLVIDQKVSTVVEELIGDLSLLNYR